MRPIQTLPQHIDHQHYTELYWSLRKARIRVETLRGWIAALDRPDAAAGTPLADKALGEIDDILDQMEGT